MFSLVLAAVVALPSPAPTPASASDAGLQEIARVRSSRSCTMLGKRIAPAVQGLLKTDDALGAGHRALLKMGADTASGNAAQLELDRWYLGQVVSVATHDLHVVQTLLSDPAYFRPDLARPDPAATDDRGADALASRLRAVAAEQRAALNLLAGALETDLMGQMQAEHDVGMAGAVSHPGSVPPSAVSPSQFMDVAGIPDHAPVAVLAPGNLASGTTINHTAYDVVARDLEGRQTRIATVERGAAQAVVEAVPLCTSPGSGESPAPVPAETAAPQK